MLGQLKIDRSTIISNLDCLVIFMVKLTTHTHTHTRAQDVQLDSFL